jgi:hypothetical protein
MMLTLHGEEAHGSRLELKIGLYKEKLEPKELAEPKCCP